MVQENAVPSVVLEDASPLSADSFAVVGTYQENGAFVLHSSLLGLSCSIKRGDTVPVHHMRPPIDLNVTDGKHGHYLHPYVEAHVVGYLPGLTGKETKGMETWLARVSRRLRPIPRTRPGWDDRYLEHYILCPPATCPQEVDRKTGNPRSWRFSCVGLVLECYRNGAGIRILDWESPDFPKIGVDTLQKVYGKEGIVASRNLKTVGLAGPGPWPVALPGYLFHALQRPAEVIRSQPYLPASNAETEYPIPSAAQLQSPAPGPP